MHRSDKPREEFARATAAWEAMRKAQSFADFEEHWREFLRRLDRVWNKTEAHYSRSPKWHSWAGKVIRLRTKDELLCYLVQARGVDEHSVGDVVEHKAGSLAIKPGASGVVHIQSLTINKGRVEGRFLGDPPVIELTPSRARLLPITNRGRTYQPPTMHLGQSIDPANVVGVAEMTLKFYENVLTETEAYFVK